MAAKTCNVSFKDSDGFRHSVEVQAETLYEAVALAATNFSAHDCLPGPMTELAVEVQAPPVVHAVTLKKVQEWTSTTAKSPKDFTQRSRVKELLEALPKS